MRNFNLFFFDESSLIFNMTLPTHWFQFIWRSLTAEDDRLLIWRFKLKLNLKNYFNIRCQYINKKCLYYKISKNFNIFFFDESSLIYNMTFSTHWFQFIWRGLTAEVDTLLIWRFELKQNLKKYFNIRWQCINTLCQYFLLFFSTHWYQYIWRGLTAEVDKLLIWRFKQNMKN